MSSEIERILSRLIKKSQIDLNQDKIPLEKFQHFQTQISEAINSYKERISLLENAIHISSEDINQFKEQLEQSHQLNIQSSKLATIGEMSSNLSHEINNPLNIISARAEMIAYELEEESPNNEYLDSYCKDIQEKVKKIASIIKGIKRIANQSEPMKKMTLSISEIFDESLLISTELSKNTNIKIESFLSSSEKMNLPPTEFSQVVLNLLSNAKHATEQSENPWIKVYSKKTDIYYDIVFENSGPKIPVDIQNKIFDSFFTTKPFGLGTGLGLPISAKIINECNGSLFLDNQANNPVFVIRFPVELLILE